jgi:hypothetical protein
MKNLKFGALALAIILTVGSSFTVKVDGLFWFDPSGNDLSRQNTVANEEAFLHSNDLSHTYNQVISGGTLVEEGYVADEPTGTHQDIYRH